MAFFEVNNIMKKFDESEILKGISFTMEKGEVLSVIGSSGSGKTTLLRCLNFLEIADKGKIILNGETLFDGDKTAKRKEEELRKKRLKMGLVFQDFNLFPQYNLLENVTLAQKLLNKEYGKKNKLSGAELKKLNSDSEKTALEIIDKVGLTDKLKFYPYQLSGGQKQRVAIARALALSPEVLCFDEPTSALDPELTGEVLKVIKELKPLNKTMIIVTHEMEFAKNISDKVIFMNKGVIEECGTPKEVFENPKSENTKNFLKNYLAGKNI